MDDHVEFLDRPAEIVFGTDTISFQAIVDGKNVTCIISFELLLGPAGTSGDEAKRVFETERPKVHQRARFLISQGKVHDGKLLIVSLI